MLLLVTGIVAALPQWAPERWQGWLQGGFIAALVAMVIAVAAGGTGSVVSELLNGWRRRRAGRDAVDDLRVVEPGGSGPAALLSPSRRVVPFAGRQSELDQLLEWCDQADADALPIRLVTGPGGVGKSRLAVELERQLQIRGRRWRRTGIRFERRSWTCVSVADNEESKAISVARASTDGRLLLIVDYAEARADLGAMLRDAIRDDGLSLRVLLLARDSGDWWQRLAATDRAIRDVLSNPEVHFRLAPEVEVDGDELVSAAADAFATARGLRRPPRVQMVGDSQPSRILDLHTAALVAVLRAEVAGRPDEQRVDIRGVLNELLGHEKRYWRASAERAGLLAGPDGMRFADLEQLIAASCLLGVSGEDDVTALAERLPGTVPATGKVADWLFGIYPPPESGQWVGLQPDRLAEHHTVNELRNSQALADSCLRDIDQRQALRAIVLLGRATAEQSDAAAFLQPILPLLDRVIDELPQEYGFLVRIADIIPAGPFAEADAAICRRILALIQEERMDLHAQWRDRLSSALYETGAFKEAAEFAEEAAAFWKDASDSDADSRQEARGHSLMNAGLFRLHWVATLRETHGRESWLRRKLSSATRELRGEIEQHSEDSLRVLEAAVDVFRVLHRADPRRHRAALEEALQRLATASSRLKFYFHAESAWRELANLDWARYAPGFADARMVVARDTKDEDRAREAEKIYRRLAQSDSRYKSKYKEMKSERRSIVAQINQWDATRD